MVSPIRSYRETHIVGLRIRRGWFGRPILQACFQLDTREFPGVTWRNAGLTKWRDVDMSNSQEVANVQCVFNAAFPDRGAGPPYPRPDPPPPPPPPRRP